MKKKAIRHIKHGLLEAEFKWKIADFFSVIEDKSVRCYQSQYLNFRGMRFQIKLLPRSHPFFGLMYLLFIIPVSYSMDFFDQYLFEYGFGFETQHGNVEKIVRKNMTKANWNWPRYVFKLSQITERKSELAPSGVVTIVCKIKCNPSSSQPKMLEEPKRMKLRKLDTLSENFKYLYFNKQNCDVTLRLKDKEYKAHKAVLTAQSSVFAAMFQQGTSEKNRGMMTRQRRKSQKRLEDGVQSQKMVCSPDVVITIPDCDCGSFELFLKFLYCGEIEDLSTNAAALQLYEISNKYNNPELKVFCMEFLIENLTVENLCDSVIIADKYDDSKLSSAAQDFFNNNVDQVLKSTKWDSLVKSNHLLSKKYVVKK